MRRLLAATVLLVAGLSMPTPAQAPGVQFDEFEALRGATIYTRYCAACHGREGRGDGPVAPGLSRKPIDLTQLQAKGQSFPYDKVARAIDGRETPRSHGAPDMPVWGEVFAKTTGTDAATVEDAVKRITQYVWSIQTPKR